jgi:hypothetical protein
MALETFFTDCQLVELQAAALELMWLDSPQNTN